MSPDLEGPDEAFAEKLAVWERNIQEYEELTGRPWDDELRVAVLLKHSPANLRNHLQLNANLFESDWSKLRATVRMYLQARRSFQGNAGMGANPPSGTSGQDHVPMDIGYLGKAKGKGRKGMKGDGFEKGQGRKETGPCYNCGKAGHLAKDCWSAKAGKGKGKGKGKEKGKQGGKGVHELTDGEASQAGKEIQQEPWMFAVGPPQQVNEYWMLVDSGSYDHVCPPSFAQDVPMQPPTSTHVVVTASGTRMTPMGSRTVSVEADAGNGRRKMLRITFVVVPVRRVLLSVGKLLRTGFTVRFDGGNGQACIERSGCTLPLDMQGNMFFLKTHVPGSPGPMATRIVAPVEQEAAGEAAAMAEGSASAMAEAAEPADPPAEPPGPTSGTSRPAGAQARGQLGEPEGEERGQAAKMVRRPPEPTEAERIRHRVTHLPYRAWCEECVKGRGLDSPHRMQGESSVPEIYLDYAFLRAEEDTDTATILLAYAPGLSLGFACQYPDKSSAEDKKSDAILAFIAECGLAGSVVQLHSDGEPAMTALLSKVASKRMDGRTLLRRGVPFSHASQGPVEKWIQQVQGMVRVYRASLKKAVGVSVGSASPWLSYMIRHSSWVLNRFAVRNDGMTGWERLHGKKYESAVFEFGEQCIGRFANATELGQAKLEERWIRGAWVGRSVMSNGHLLATAQGVLECRSIKAVPASERFLPSFYAQIVWSADEGGTGLQQAAVGDIPADGDDQGQPIGRTQAARDLHHFWSVQGRTPSCYAGLHQRR